MKQVLIALIRITALAVQLITQLGATVLQVTSDVFERIAQKLDN